jgi:hypothetical protein
MIQQDFLWRILWCEVQRLVGTTLRKQLYGFINQLFFDSPGLISSMSGDSCFALELSRKIPSFLAKYR